MCRSVHTLASRDGGWPALGPASPRTIPFPTSPDAQFKLRNRTHSASVNQRFHQHDRLMGELGGIGKRGAWKRFSSWRRKGKRGTKSADTPQAGAARTKRTQDALPCVPDQAPRQALSRVEECGEGKPALGERDDVGSVLFLWCAHNFSNDIFKPEPGAVRFS